LKRGRILVSTEYSLDLVASGGYPK